MASYWVLRVLFDAWSSLEDSLTKIFHHLTVMIVKIQTFIKALVQLFGTVHETSLRDIGLARTVFKEIFVSVFLFANQVQRVEFRNTLARLVF